MKTLTAEEAREWCTTVGVGLDERGKPTLPSEEIHSRRFELPKTASRCTWFANFVENSLQPRDRCLLWIVGWGVWPSSENWHLYYRLRKSYGDERFLDEASAHLFLDFERPDLVSFLELGLIFGWDMHLLPSAGYGRAFVSHDEWVELAMTDPAEMAKVEADLAKAGVHALKARDRTSE